MANPHLNRAFYEAILNFDHSEEAQDLYYKVMDTPTGKKNSAGREETIRDQILRTYAMLFCDDLDTVPGQPAGPEEVEITADRLYIGEMQLDPQHWYRMKYHFPVIDDDNYDRFAALVVADLRSGPLRDSVFEDGAMLLVGAADPLHMTSEERKNQKVSAVRLPGGYDNDDHSGR